MAKFGGAGRLILVLISSFLILGITNCQKCSCQRIVDRYVLQVTPPGLSPVIDGSIQEWSESRFDRIQLRNLKVSGERGAGADRSSRQIVLERDGHWGGEADLSGWVSLALDPTALYLIGQVRDDHIVPPESMDLATWTQADVIEVFLDTDPSDARGRRQDEHEKDRKGVYSEDDYQIFLFPKHEGGSSWAVIRRGPGFLGGDAGFEGVQVKFRMLEKGDGYTFEARFPLINFPHLKRIKNGYRIGFNIALGDREPGDQGMNKYVYMTWNGKQNLFQDPDQFGSAIVHDPGQRFTRGAISSDDSGTGYLLLAMGLAGALVLFAFFFTLLVRWIAGWPLGRKLVVAGTMTLALVVVVVLSAVVRHFSNRFVEERVAKCAQQVKEVVTECGQLISRENMSTKMLELLNMGVPVDTKRSYEYHYFPVGRPIGVNLPPSARADLPPDHSGTPRYLGNWTGIEVSRGGRTRFHLLPDEVGSVLSVVLSVSRRSVADPARLTPRPGQLIASVFACAGAKNERRSEALRLCLDSERRLCVMGAGEEAKTLDEFSVSGLADSRARTLFHIVLDTGRLGEDKTGSRKTTASEPTADGTSPPPYGLIIKPEDDGYIVEVNGLSTYRGGKWHGIPFRVDSNVGHPLELVPGLAGPSVSARQGWARPIAIGRPLDRLWIYFKCVHGYPFGSLPGTKVAEVVLRYADGKEDRRPLESGRHLESFRRRREKHPAGMEAQVALNGIWDRDSSGFPRRTRRDVLTIALRANRPAPLESVAIEWAKGCRGPEEIFVTAVTGGTSRPMEPEDPRPENPWITAPDPGAIQLTEAGRKALKDFRITASVIPGVAGQEPRREGREVVAYIPLDNYSGLRLALSLVPYPLIEGARKWAGMALLACLLPLLLVLAADSLSRSRRLRVKLFLAIGLVGMPPLALLVVYLDDEIKARLSERIDRRARTAAVEVAEEVSRMASRVSTIARDVADPKKNPELRALLEQETPAIVDQDLQRELERLEAKWPESERNEIEVLLWDARLRRVHRGGASPGDSTFDWLLPRVDRSGLYDHYGSIVAVGFAALDTAQEPERWNLCVVGPITPRFIEGTLSGDPEVTPIAFYPGAGYPYAGMGRRGEDHRFGGTRESRILGLRAASEPRTTVLGERPVDGVASTVGARVLRDAIGEPVLVVGAAVNRERAFKLREKIRNSALVVGAVMLLLFVVITFLVTRRIIDPLVDLSRAARKLAEGKGKMPRVRIHSRDEIGNLTEAFNDMAVQLRKRLKGLDLLNTGMRALNDRRTLQGILETVIQTFEEALSPTTVFLALHDLDRAAFDVLGGSRNGRPLKPRSVAATDSFLLQAMNTGGPERIRGLRWMTLTRGEEPLFKTNRNAFGPEDVVTLPLDYQGDPIGLIVLVLDTRQAGRTGRPVDREGLLVLATMASQIAGALENARLYRLAVEDPVTGLFLQGFFEGRLKDEIQRAARHGRSLTLIKLRIEEIPILASRYGPTGLNNALKAVSQAVRSVLEREEHFAARFEDNHFALALPEADRSVGVTIAHRVAAALLQNPVPLGKGRPLPLTPRFGVVTFPAEAASFEFLLEEADQALETAEALQAEPTDTASSDLEEAAPERFEEDGVVLKNPRSLEIVRTIERVARSPVTVLLTGETGTGKEVFAELIHRRSERRNRPLIKVNCAALPELLLESELFGHERGAFTGAYKRKSGRFELAHGGTLFLDEIGEITPSTQVKLLRVLQDKCIERLGGTESIALDVRIVAATNQDMLELIRNGRFREDLFYRLNVISIHIPPLRERKDEIPLLVERFLLQFNREHENAIAGIRPQAMDRLHNHNWPGNIRELKNVLDSAMVAADRGGHIEPDFIRLPEPTLKAVRPDPEPIPTRESGSPAPEPLAEPTSPRFEDLEGVVSNPRQIELLKYLRQRKSITNQEYFTMMNISQRTGLRDLNDLINKGLIRRIGARRGAIYKMMDNGDQGRS